MCKLGNLFIVVVNFLVIVGIVFIVNFYINNYDELWDNKYVISWFCEVKKIIIY